MKFISCIASGMHKPYPTLIPGLRSPTEMVGGIVYLGRMLDKIRLHSLGKLPEEWAALMGAGYFDARCCNFLNIDYAELSTETVKGEDDQQILAWAFSKGRKPTEEEIEIWNAFMVKRGWRDAASQRVSDRLSEIGLEPDAVATLFEFIDLDEGRD